MDKYLKFYDAFLRKHNLYARVFNLASDTKQGEPLTRKQIKEYEEIDRRRVQGMKFAEKKCRHLRVGCVEWSPELEEALDTHRYWHLSLLKKKGHKISARRLVRLANKWAIVKELTATEETLQKLVAEAFKAYSKIKENATTLRGKWLVDL